MHGNDGGEQLAGTGARRFRGMVGRSCAALLLAATLLLGAGVHGLVYLALEGEKVSSAMMLRLPGRAVCALLRACSP